MATHARRRYRLLSKNPSVPSPPPDPQVWLVHYTQAEPRKVVPAQNIKPEDMTQRVFQERRWIESHGPLQRQEFMLSQREMWPQLQLAQRKASSPGQTQYPRGPVTQPPVAHPANARFSGQYYQQQPGQSPAKRQRQNPQLPQPPQSAHSNMAPTQPFQAPDTSIEDEEDVTYGDLLDQLTQRELSLTRYMQHHEWMEEIFSSPYATDQIIPVDLGFGLAGELSGVTEGIFDSVPKPRDAASQHKKLQPQELQEFEKRISEHKNKVEAEMKAMRESHAKAMADVKRSKVLLRAERQLRNAGQAAAEAIVKDVETACGGRVVPAETEKMIERGGLKDKVQPAPPQDTVMGGTLPMSAVAPNAPTAGQTQMATPTAAPVQQAVAAALVPQPQAPMTSHLPQDTDMSVDSTPATQAASLQAQAPTAVPASISAPQMQAIPQQPQPGVPTAMQPPQTAVAPTAPAVPAVSDAAGLMPAPAPIVPTAQSNDLAASAMTTQDNITPDTADASTASMAQAQAGLQGEDGTVGLQGLVKEIPPSAGLDMPAPGSAPVDAAAATAPGANEVASSLNATQGAGTEDHAPPAL